MVRLPQLIDIGGPPLLFVEQNTEEGECEICDWLGLVTVTNDNVRICLQCHADINGYKLAEEYRR